MQREFGVVKRFVLLIAISAVITGALPGGALAVPTISNASKARTAGNSNARLSIGSYIKGKSIASGKTLTISGTAPSSSSPGTSGGGSIPPDLGQWKDWANNLLRDMPGVYATKSELTDALANIEIPNHDALATKDFVGDAIADALSGAGALQGKSAYEVAVENGFNGNETQWLNSLKGANGAGGQPGAPGADGREIALQVDGEFIKWQYSGDASWSNLIDIDSLKGAAGANGRDIELQKTAAYIQWRYVGDAAWNDLVALSEITGPAGDGASLPSSGTYIVQDGSWTSVSFTGNYGE